MNRCFVWSVWSKFGRHLLKYREWFIKSGRFPSDLKFKLRWLNQTQRSIQYSQYQARMNQKLHQGKENCPKGRYKGVKRFFLEETLHQWAPCRTQEANKKQAIFGTTVPISKSTSTCPTSSSTNTSLFLVGAVKCLPLLNRHPPRKQKNCVQYNRFLVGAAGCLSLSDRHATRK